MENEKKKILIIGSSAKEDALAKVFAGYDFVEKVYVAPGNDAIAEFCEIVDIRVDDISGLLNFAMENAIDLTIASDEKTIKEDISSLFQQNGQLIFAPSAVSANAVVSKSAGKKLFYKLRIPTPKFGIFEKAQLAIDYVNKSSFPLVIRADESSVCADRQICNTARTAAVFVEDLFLSGHSKILLEDYVYGDEFVFYVVTDGYHYLPLTSCSNYKLMEDGNGGILTPGMGAFCPNYKLSYDIQKQILKNVVEPIIGGLARRETPYLGILGVEGVLTPDGNYSVLELKSFLSDHDCQAVLNLVDENLYTLFEACANGSFADDYESINVSDKASVSCVLSSGNIKESLINGLELLDDDICVNHFATKRNEFFEYYTTGGRAVVLTKTSSTLTRARELLYENIEVITFSGKKYRSDICKFSD